jgi:hypothetical protein
MDNGAGTLKAVPLIVGLAVVASCGSSDTGSGAWTGGGGTGGVGGSSGGVGAGSGGATGSNRGGGAGSSSSGSGAGAGSGGGLVGTGVIGDAGGSDAGITNQPCAVPGATQACCGGTQTCTGIGEFASWGPCLDSAGAPATCNPPPPPPCVTNENGTACDGGVDAPPPPPPPPPPPALCTDPVVSTEPQILVGYQPGMGQTVGSTGQIKVWVNDENPPFIAPGEQVDNTTGAITTPGNRTAMAADGLLYEPALYIAPQTPTNGGAPHFAQWIKGSYNNNPPTRGTFAAGAPMDPPPAGSNLAARYTGEFIWDVSALGLAPGSYTAVFSVHDGDRDRAIGCVNIVITP